MNDSPLLAAMSAAPQAQSDPTEIIRAAAPSQAPDVPVDQVVQSVLAELQAPDTIWEVIGKTLFIAHPSPEAPTGAMFRVLNADTPQNYISATYQFFQRLKGEGIRVLVTQFKDPSIINIAKGVDKLYHKDAAMGFQVQKTSDGGFQMTIDLGSAQP